MKAMTHAPKGNDQRGNTKATAQAMAFIGGGSRM
jgi:hypothetical protein